MRAAGNNAELRQAELHLVEKQKLVDMALAALTKYTVAATEPGEVVETLAKIGMPIAAGKPVARVKGRVLHGAFELDGEERATLAKMDFCRVEVVGLGPRASNDLPRNEGSATAADTGAAEAQIGPRFLDCKPPGGAAAPSSGRVEIPLPGELGLVSGQPLRLARRRFDAVFPVPAAAVVADGDRRLGLDCGARRHRRAARGDGHRRQRGRARQRGPAGGRSGDRRPARRAAPRRPHRARSLAERARPRCAAAR